MYSGVATEGIKETKAVELRGGRILTMSLLSSSTDAISVPSPSSSTVSVFKPLISSESPHSRSSKRKPSEFYQVPLQGDRITKLAWKRRERKRTIAKLRRMLPHEQNVVQCSELELINYIMDYIVSLQKMLESEENMADENYPSTMDIANLNRALSHFHLCTNKRRPLRPSKQMCT
uniref:BHLH domain-containing protein n=1 Tax=Onchocerca volvulus TaxID=6282 RepID=A0A8R1TPL8_ONCVO